MKAALTAMLFLAFANACGTTATTTSQTSKQKLAIKMLGLAGSNMVNQFDIDRVVDSLLPGQRAKARLLLDKREILNFQAALYTRHFTETELKDLIVFWKTPSAAKFARNKVLFFKKGEEIGQDYVMKKKSGQTIRIPKPGGDPDDPLRLSMEMIAVTGELAALKKGIEMVTDDIGKANPDAAAEIRKLVDYRELGALLAEIYPKHLTAGEMRDLIDFSKTPTGKKIAVLHPTLFTEGSTWAKSYFQERLGQLK